MYLHMQSKFKTNNNGDGNGNGNTSPTYLQCHPKQTETFQPYAHMNIASFMSQYL